MQTKVAMKLTVDDRVTWLSWRTAELTDVAAEWGGCVVSSWWRSRSRARARCSLRSSGSDGIVILVCGYSQQQIDYYSHVVPKKMLIFNLIHEDLFTVTYSPIRAASTVIPLLPNARATLDKQSCVITPTFVYHD